MAFTRFNYDECRTTKILQESTGPGRYMLNTPGSGCNPCFMSDPHIRMQKWGANLMRVKDGHPIDIDSDLIGITRKLTRDCQSKEYPNKGVVDAQNRSFPTCAPFTDETRTTHPAWMYKDLEQTRKHPLFLNPQENLCMPFMNNLNTRILEKDNYVPEIPCLLEERIVNSSRIH